MELPKTFVGHHLHLFTPIYCFLLVSIRRLFYSSFRGDLSARGTLLPFSLWSCLCAIPVHFKFYIEPTRNWSDKQGQCSTEKQLIWDVQFGIQICIE